MRRCDSISRVRCLPTGLPSDTPALRRVPLARQVDSVSRGLPRAPSTRRAFRHRGAADRERRWRPAASNGQWRPGRRQEARSVGWEKRFGEGVAAQILMRDRAELSDRRGCDWIVLRSLLGCRGIESGVREHLRRIDASENLRFDEARTTPQVLKQLVEIIQKGLLVSVRKRPQIGHNRPRRRVRFLLKVCH